MANSLLPEKSGWTKLVLLLFMLFPRDGPCQVPGCAGGSQNRIPGIAALISAGRYELADWFLESCLREIRIQRPFDSAAAADLIYLEGNIALLRDDPETALVKFDEARAYATGLAQLSRIDQNTGSAWLVAGNYRRAHRYFSHSLKELEYAGSPSPARLLALYGNLGAAAFESGSLDEADKWWDLAAGVAETHFSSDSAVLSDAMHRSGLAAFGKNDYEEAAGHFRLALQFYPGKQGPWDRTGIMYRKNLALSLLKDDNISGVEQALPGTGSADAAIRSKAPVLCAEILRLSAWIAFARGKRLTADSLFQCAFLVNAGKPGGEASGLARLERFRIQRDRASMLFLGSASPDTVFRECMRALGWLKDCRSPDGSYPHYLILHDSVDLLVQRTVSAAYGLPGGCSGIFDTLVAIADILNSRPVRSDVSAHGSVNDTLTAQWLNTERQLYRLRKRLWQTESLISPDPADELGIFVLEQQADRLEKLILNSRDGPSASSDPGVAAGKSLRSLPGPEAAILGYLPVNGRMFIFLIRNDTAMLFHHLAGPDFHEAVARLPEALGTADVELPGLLQAVSGVLFGPVAPHLLNVRRLYIVPGGVLSGIPFECLQLPDGRTVVEQFAISYHSAWRGISTDGSGNRAREDDPGEGNCGLIAFAPSAGKEENLATLAGAKGEAEEIASMFMAHGRQIKVFTGSTAGEAKLLEASESYGIIHIATHSRVDRQIPERSGLHLWKEPPSVTGDELVDGILEMGEVRGLRLRCPLLTISSCAIQQPGHRNRIGSPSVPADFLDAGAEQVIFSLWNVSDRHTRTLMTGFYRNYLNGDDFAEALRKAKVAMLRNPSTASPYFWAPFILSMQ